MGKDQLTLWLAGSSHYRGVVPGLEIIFFPGSPILHIQKLPKGVYRDEFIFGLRAEIRGGRRRIQGSPGLLTHPYFEPWVRFPRSPAKCPPPPPPPPIQWLCKPSSHPSPFTLVPQAFTQSHYFDSFHT